MKTSRLLLILLLLATTMNLFSCKNSNSGKVSYSYKDSFQVDTLWNEKVQNVFFDTPFGASKQEVIKNFAKHGFTYNRTFSGEERLVFDYRGAKYYNFGGMSWELLDVYFNNGKFTAISFYTPYKDKAEAISGYENIADVLSKKYYLTTTEPDDSTVYGIQCALSKSNIIAQVRCYRYESVGKEIFYSTELFYADENIEYEVSDEL